MSERSFQYSWNGDTGFLCVGFEIHLDTHTQQRISLSNLITMDCHKQYLFLPNQHHPLFSARDSSVEQITIHKAMGSEYETVIMPLLKAHTIMMYRNLLYTGITRAKKRVVLIGQKQVLFMAIHRNEIGKRNTLLGMRIQMYFKAYAKKAGIPIPAALEEQLKNAS